MVSEGGGKGIGGKFGYRDPEGLGWDSNGSGDVIIVNIIAQNG
jgi:hypothetical protein